MNGQVNERDPDIQSWRNEVEALLGNLEPEGKLQRDDAQFRNDPSNYKPIACLNA